MPALAQDAGAQSSPSSPPVQGGPASLPPAAVSGPPFKSGVELVALTVTVTDARQRLVSDLTASDFVVLEDGVPQPVTFFDAGRVPADLTLLVDASASMKDKLPLVQDAASDLLRTLRPGDRASLVEFRTTVQVMQPLTSDIDKVVEGLRHLQAEGSTSLYNAMYVTLRELQAQKQDASPVRRRAVVVLSDGQDTNSLLPFDDVLEVARRSGVTVYTVALKSETESVMLRTDPRLSQKVEQSDYAMRALAAETGARSFFLSKATELKQVYSAVAAELASQYSIGYVSSNVNRDGAWRRLLVRIAQHAGVRSRTRSGYYAGRSTRAASLR